MELATKNTLRTAVTGWAGLAATGTLALALSCALAAPAQAWGAAPAVYGKDENVYATLAYNGEVTDLHVVNQFDVAASGSIEDAGSYDKVSNLTSDAAIESAGGTQTVHAEEGVFYYQGDIDGGALPWDFDITYWLDGREVAAEELAGAEGRVEVRVASSLNDAVPAQFGQTFLLQIALTVPADVCRNIDPGTGAIADAGSDRRITYTVMPGQNADASFSADVEGFEMGSISIAGASVVPSGSASGAAPELISFTSPGNDEHIERVQFAMTTDAIEAPEVEVEVPEEPERTFIERVLALFGF